MTVFLANPQEVKNRKGHKTDKKDSWWLAHLLRHAMIRPSFIPPRGIRELRDLTRRRKKMIGTATSERNRVEKILQDANVKLSSVLSDLFGVSGQLMLEALLEGKAKPEEIAQFAKCRAKQKIPAIIAALEEHRMSDHHRKMIRFSLEHLRFLEEQILQLDEEIIRSINWGVFRNGSSYKRFPVSNKPARPTFWPKLVRICSSLLPRSTSVLGRGSVRVTIEAPVKTRAANRLVAIVGYVQHSQNALGQFPPKRTAT